MSSASRSRIAFAYSVRFSRCSAGVTSARQGSTAVSRRARARMRTVERRSLRTRRAARRHHAGADLLDDLLPRLGAARPAKSSVSSARPPVFARWLWQVMQYCLRNAALGGTDFARREGAASPIEALPSICASRGRRRADEGSPRPATKSTLRLRRGDLSGHVALRWLDRGHQLLEQLDRAWFRLARMGRQEHALRPTSAACVLPCP